MPRNGERHVYCRGMRVGLRCARIRSRWPEQIAMVETDFGAGTRSQQAGMHTRRLLFELRRIATHTTPVSDTGRRRSATSEGGQPVKLKLFASRWFIGARTHLDRASG